ncbi:unnamed protein product [Hermetia illucens]|uniref:Uncharacterized protein n=1 Tax=Hermetia illucens TaxID=343691 RepID=A0A7R8V2S2_HERIL|nr:unnamed protein product [Hermetia illucens]
MSALNWTANDLRDTVKSLQFTIQAAFPDKVWEDKQKQQSTAATDFPPLGSKKRATNVLPVPASSQHQQVNRPAVPAVAPATPAQRGPANQQTSKCSNQPKQNSHTPKIAPPPPNVVKLRKKSHTESTAVAPITRPTTATALHLFVSSPNRTHRNNFSQLRDLSFTKPAISFAGAVRTSTQQIPRTQPKMKVNA